MQNHNRLVLSDLNPSALIPIIENAINLETTVKTANRILNNEIEYLTSDYRITQAKMLLSLLRRRDLF
jgi:hypothetical protein